MTVGQMPYLAHPWLRLWLLHAPYIGKIFEDESLLQINFRGWPSTQLSLKTYHSVFCVVKISRLQANLQKQLNYHVFTLKIFQCMVALLILSFMLHVYMHIIILYIYVTVRAKTSLVHTFKFTTLVLYTFGWEKSTELKFAMLVH